MHVGQGGQLGPPHVRHHQPGTPGHRALDRGTEDGVVLGDVGAAHEDDVARLLDFPHRAGGGGGAEGAAHGRHRGGVAEAGAVVHVVGAEGAADHPHEEVVVLVAALGGGEGREGAGAVLPLDPEEFLRREAQRLLPGGLPERVVPLGRGGGAVAHVAVAHHREPRLRRLPDASLGGTGLPCAAELLDGGPGPLAVPGELAGPAPPSLLAHPPLADQRHGEAVAVLGKVRPEPPFHAGAPLVRRVLLDPGARDPHQLAVLHVQVHLAADPAVGADRAGDRVRSPHRLLAEALAREHLEDGPRGADADALAAPGAARVVRIAVAPDDDLGVHAALADVEDAHLLDAVAGAHAAGAEDAERHVVLDHHVARPGVAPAQAQRLLRREGHVVAADVLLEFVAGRGGVAVAAEVLEGVALEEEAQHAAAVGHGGVALGVHHHAVGGGGGAGGDELALAGHRHEAEPAVPDGREPGIPAERRDLVAAGARGVEDRGALGNRNGLPVERERRHRSAGSVGGGHVESTGAPPGRQGRAWRPKLPAIDASRPGGRRSAPEAR